MRGEYRPLMIGADRFAFAEIDCDAGHSARRHCAEDRFRVSMHVTAKDAANLGMPAELRHKGLDIGPQLELERVGHDIDRERGMMQEQDRRPGRIRCQHPLEVRPARLA